jgi:hypothetical protein
VDVVALHRKVHEPRVEPLERSLQAAQYRTEGLVATQAAHLRLDAPHDVQRVMAREARTAHMVRAGALALRLAPRAAALAAPGAEVEGELVGLAGLAGRSGHPGSMAPRSDMRARVAGTNVT